jgi:hypothetical protein
MIVLSPFTFCLDTKSKQKGQGYARFAQKTGVHRRKSSELAPSSLKQGRFLRRLTCFLAYADRWLTHRTRPVKSA